MAKIAALMTGGGSQTIDLLTPDVQYDAANGVGSGNIDITVTKKPKYIVMVLIAKVSGNTGMFGIWDVENDTAKRKGYWSSSGQAWQDWLNRTSFFPTVTDTKVTYNASTWGSTHRLFINIYY